MSQQERTMSPSMTTQMSNVVKSSARSSLSPLRHRTLNRASTFADNYQTLRPRRSSTFSDTAQSFKSSTDNLLLPRAKNPEEVVQHEEHSHWHSVPLALALLPALGGLFFKNGGAVVTDVTLLALAAVFLNWSVRLPWDWYYAAQEVKVQDPHPLQSYKDRNTIIEEASDEDGSQPSQPTSPGIENQQRNQVEKSASPEADTSHPHTSAARELRIHEFFALLTCFISPIIGAWLLHHIRAQLSRPSEGLVSNYNLTIFLLASELRPMSHMIRLVQARTLHLQRVVSANPYQNSSSTSPEHINDLTDRIAALESNMTNGAPKSPTSIQQQQQELIMATRKALQPDFDPLNRAVRRYEKRATLSTMQTEARLHDLENKLADAITLAAAAERSSQATKQRRGSGVVVIVDWASKAIGFPMQMAWAVVSLPGKAFSAGTQYLENFIGSRIGREMKTAGKSDSRFNKEPDRRRGVKGEKKTS